MKCHDCHHTCDRINANQSFPFGELKIGDEELEVNESTLCLTLANEGFSCVPQNQCENLIDLLFNSSSLICEDSSQTCCHESQKIENVTISTKNEKGEG